MPDIPPLETFGRRIMICGPSNSGKSTLAAAIGRKLGIPAVHLDQIHHIPNSNWVKRPRDEFVALHDKAILDDAWAMDGNYSGLFPQRLARATGIVLLSDHRFANFARYIRRTLFERNRPGALEGAQDSLNWNMTRWILITSPRNMRRYHVDLPASGLPFLHLHGMSDLRRLYETWGLTRG